MSLAKQSLAKQCLWPGRVSSPASLTAVTFESGSLWFKVLVDCQGSAVRLTLVLR